MNWTDEHMLIMQTCEMIVVLLQAVKAAPEQFKNINDNEVETWVKINIKTFLGDKTKDDQEVLIDCITKVINEKI